MRRTGLAAALFDAYDMLRSERSAPADRAGAV